VVWYQGEDDGSRESTALKYKEMLPALIDNWRTDWGQGEFPFNFVQLALISGRPTWAILRDAQVSTLDVRPTNTAMARIIDVPTLPPSDIHPKDKEPVGERLALAAIGQSYPHLNIVAPGPIRNKSLSFVSDKSIVVKFDHADGGLMLDAGDAPSPFLIAGANGIYYPATATFSPDDPDAVIVSNPISVPEPHSVRYCWDSYPLCNLFNAFGLPASPFQTTLP